MTPYEIIDEACWKALRLGFEFSKDFTLVVKDGYYVPVDNDKPTCHVLEAVLLGELATVVPFGSSVGLENSVEDRKNDIYQLLKVDRHWVDNFFKAYQDTSTDAYEAAKKIHAKYPVTKLV
jgi:hypothetical protein